MTGVYMKKIFLLIWSVCILVCIISLSKISINAVERSKYDELTEIYRNECERINEQNDYFETLVCRIQENWLVEDKNGKIYWAISDRK